MNLQKQIKMKIKWTLWQDNLQLYHQLNENITLLFLGIKDGRKHQSFGYASFCLQFYKVKQVAGKGLKILRSTEWHKKLTKILRVVLRMVQKKYGHFLWTVFNCLGVAGPLITQEILIPFDRPASKDEKELCGPFLWVGLNCLKASVLNLHYKETVYLDRHPLSPQKSAVLLWSTTKG